MERQLILVLINVDYVIADTRVGIPTVVDLSNHVKVLRLAHLPIRQGVDESDHG